MSIKPPSPDGSTGMTIFTFGSALSEISLIAPVMRSATSAVLLSMPMIKPLVLSRQPCITPGAGHAFGKGVGGSGGGGGGEELGCGLSAGFVVNGCDWASLNRAHPLNTSAAKHSAASAHRADRRIRMTDRLRTLRTSPPHTRLRQPSKAVVPANPCPDTWPGSLWGHSAPAGGQTVELSGESAAQIPDSGRIALTLTRVTSQSHDSSWRRPGDLPEPLPGRPASASLVDPEDDLTPVGSPGECGTT